MRYPFDGKRLRHLRIRCGWSQQDLADRIGVNWRSVVRWENGHAAPQPRVLRLLADAVDVECAALIKEE